MFFDVIVSRRICIGCDVDIVVVVFAVVVPIGHVDVPAILPIISLPIISLTISPTTTTIIIIIMIIIAHDATVQ